MTESDRNKKIVDYFKKNLDKGYTSDTLKWALIDQGHSRVAVQRALDQANQEILNERPVLKDKPIIRREIYTNGNKPIPIKYKKKPFWKSFLGLE